MGLKRTEKGLKRDQKRPEKRAETKEDVDQAQHLTIKTRNGFRRHTVRERTVRILQRTESFSELPVL